MLRFLVLGLSIRLDNLMIKSIGRFKFYLAILLLVLIGGAASGNDLTSDRQRSLYVASPGVRDNLEWGGHGVLVFDIDDKHRFVKRIRLDEYGLDQTGKILNVKGICANANN